MTTKRKLQAETTRSGLIEAAFQLNQQKDYLDISITDICEKCNVTKGAFYHHFNSKDEIFYWVYKKSEDQFLEQALKPYLDSEDCTALFKRYYHALTTFKKQDIHQTQQQYKILLSMNAMANEELLHSKSVDYLCFIINKGIENGEFNTPLPIDYYLNMIFGTMTGLYMQWCTFQLYDIDATIQQLADIWLYELTEKHK